MSMDIKYDHRLAEYIAAAFIANRLDVSISCAWKKYVHHQTELGDLWKLAARLIEEMQKAEKEICVIVDGEQLVRLNVDKPQSVRIN